MDLLILGWVALHILNRWQYTEAMPKLPVLNVGLVSVLQMMVLPALVFSRQQGIKRMFTSRQPGSSQKEIIE